MHLQKLARKSLNPSYHSVVDHFCWKIHRRWWIIDIKIGLGSFCDFEWRRLGREVQLAKVCALIWVCNIVHAESNWLWTRFVLIDLYEKSSRLFEDLRDSSVFLRCPEFVSEITDFQFVKFLCFELGRDNQLRSVTSSLDHLGRCINMIKESLNKTLSWALYTFDTLDIVYTSTLYFVETFLTRLEFCRKSTKSFDKIWRDAILTKCNNF